jgi:predicted methyltransferase
MESQQQATQQDLSQWIKAFEHQKQELDQQIQQFDALQQEMQALASQAAHSSKVDKKLEQVKALENNTDYIRMRDHAMEQIARLEQQFSKLVDWSEGPPITNGTNRRQSESARTKNQPLQQTFAKKTARGFV